MNRKRLNWLVLLVLFILSAVGLKLWQRHVENSFDTIRSPDQSAAWMKAAQSEVTGKIVIAIGSLDHPNVNNRDTNLPAALARYLISLRETNLTFVERKLSEKPNAAAANWVLEGSYDTYTAGKARVFLTLMRVRGGYKSIDIDGSLGTDLHVKIAQAVKDTVRTPDPALARYS